MKTVARLSGRIAFAIGCLALAASFVPLLHTRVRWVRVPPTCTCVLRVLSSPSGWRRLRSSALELLPITPPAATGPSQYWGALRDTEQHGRHARLTSGAFMQLTSSAFRNGEPIPRQFTCEGQNGSPEFSWMDAPKETKSFVFLLHDPDAPRKMVLHTGCSTTFPRISPISARTCRESVRRDTTFVRSPCSTRHRLCPRASHERIIVSNILNAETALTACG